MPMIIMIITEVQEKHTEVRSSAIFRNLASIAILYFLVASLSSAIAVESLSIGQRKQAKNLLNFSKAGNAFGFRKQINAKLDDETKHQSFTTQFEKKQQAFFNDVDFPIEYPALDYYFSHILKLQRKIAIPENRKPTLKVPFTSIFSGNMSQSINLDIKKIYEVHYLHVSHSNAWKNPAGGFGHSMLRLIVCSPERNEPSAECLDDVEYHIALSYQADSGGEAFSNFKGFYGSYPSRLVIQPFLEVIDRYTSYESRKIISYPLNPEIFSTELILRKVYENTQYYESHYFFTGRNCATELLDLLKCSTTNLDLHAINSVMPGKLRDQLLHYKFIFDKAKNSAPVDLKPYHWPKAKREAKEILAKLKSLTSIDASDLDEYLEKLGTNTRPQALYEQLERSDVDRSRVIKLLFRLELIILKKVKFAQMTYLSDLSARSKRGEKLKGNEAILAQYVLDPSPSTSEAFIKALEAQKGPAVQALNQSIAIVDWLGAMF